MSLLTRKVQKRGVQGWEQAEGSHETDERGPVEAVSRILAKHRITENQSVDKESRRAA